MRVGLLEAKTLETLRMPQHLAPLPSPGGALRGACLWARHPHLAPLCRFLPRGNPAPGRQATCQAMGRRRLASPMALGDAAKRCDRLGADRHADVLQPERRGGLPREGKSGATLLTPSGRRHGVHQRLAPGSGIVREPGGVAHLLACKQPCGIVSKPRDEGLTGGPLLQTPPHPGPGRAAFGAPGWRELAHVSGPSAQAMCMHQAGCGAYVRWRQTRQHRGRACARDPPTGRHKGRACRGILREALAHPGHGVRAIVATRAAQSLALLTQSGNGLLPSAAPVFAGGGRASHGSEAAAAPRGKRLARPGIRHAAPETVDRLQGEGPWSAGRGMGLTGQDGQHLARAQAHTAVDHPAEAVRTGGRTQGQALEHASRCDAHSGASHDPSDEGLRAGRLLDAKDPREETQDARDGAQAATRHAKAWPGQADHVSLGPGDQRLPWALERTQTRPGRCEGVGGAVALGGDARDLWAWVAIVRAALLGCVFPLMSTVCDCGELAQHACSWQIPWPQAMRCVPGCKKRIP